MSHGTMLSDELEWIRFNIVWAAGFWEGEGSCGIYPVNYNTPDDGKIRLVVSVTQTDIEPIKRFQRIFGGSCRPSYKSRPDHHKESWIWDCNGMLGYLALKTIRPYIVSSYKQNQIDNCIDQYENYRIKTENAKYIKSREYKNGTRYTVRVTLPETDEYSYLGEFHSPAIAKAALNAAIGEDFRIFTSKKGGDNIDE